MASNVQPQTLADMRLSYWDQYKNYLPNNVASSAALSGLVNFAFHTLLTSNPVLGVANGALGALATVVDSAVKPIFKMVFGDVLRPKSFTEIFLRTTVVLAAVSLLAPTLGVTVESLASAVFYQVIWEAVQCDNSNNATIYI